jgi:hypothetical protein
MEEPRVDILHQMDQQEPEAKVLLFRFCILSYMLCIETRSTGNQTRFDSFSPTHSIEESMDEGVYAAGRANEAPGAYEHAFQVCRTKSKACAPLTIQWSYFPLEFGVEC